MNKIASYLNQHLLGEVTSAKSILKRYSTDGGVLAVDPEIVAFPRITTDIRKIARFTWQLAEKGHIVGLTARGFGGDVTGAAIGKGIVIDMSKQYDAILEVAVKDKLVHAQAGAPLPRCASAFPGPVGSDQCLKARWPVRTIVTPASLHASITSQSRRDPPGWTTAVTP